MVLGLLVLVIAVVLLMGLNVQFWRSLTAAAVIAAMIIIAIAGIRGGLPCMGTAKAYDHLIAVPKGFCKT